MHKIMVLKYFNKTHQLQLKDFTSIRKKKKEKNIAYDVYNQQKKINTFVLHFLKYRLVR